MSQPEEDSKLHYIKKDIAIKFAKELVSGYLKLNKLLGVGLDDELFQLDRSENKNKDKETPKDKETLKDKETPKDKTHKDFIKNVADNPFVELNDRLIHKLHTVLLAIADDYQKFKNDREIIVKRMSFISVFFGFTSVVEELLKDFSLKHMKQKLALQINLLISNEYFKWHQYPSNLILKTLRNMRAHNSHILDQPDFKAACDDKNFSMTFLKFFSYHEAKNLHQQLLKFEKVILYDKSEKGNITALLVINPEEFLAKIITILHYISFLSGKRDNLVFSRRALESLKNKIGPEEITLNEMTVKSHKEEVNKIITECTPDVVNFEEVEAKE